MSTTTITYTDLDGSAPKTSWHGTDFITGKPVEVDDDLDARLIEAARGNAWFEVKSGEAPSGVVTPYDRGFKAGQDGKDRSVPPSYRGKPEADAWLAGYDDGARAAGLTAPNPTASGVPVSPSTQNLST